jgi:hypothetical protein
MVGGSYGTGAGSRGAEWWSEVAGCGGDAAELWRSRRKLMAGGPTYQPTTERGEGSARCGVSPRGRRQSCRAPPTHGGLGQEGGPGRLRGGGPVGRGRAAGWGRKKEVGHGSAGN